MLVATSTHQAHRRTSTFPWGFGSRSAFRFPAVRAGRGCCGRAARVRGAQTQRLLIRCGQRGQLSALGLREKGLQERRNRRLGPGATDAGRRRVRPAPPWLREELTLPRPHDFRSSIMDPREFLSGLKGITQIAETWLSGSGRNPTSNRNRNFSRTKCPGFYGKAYLRSRYQLFTVSAVVFSLTRRARIAWFQR